jgi:membrane protein required for colicin V production
MIIDLLFAVLLVLAVIKGYSRGLIIGVFSLVALVVGLAAAMKLSTVAAGWIDNTVNVSAKWLPVIAFVVVFVLAVLLVRLGARALEKTVEWAMLGWLNRIGGVIFYLVLYIVIFSVALFYAGKVNLVSESTIAASKTYGFIEPWGPRVINALGAVIPWFKDMFHELEVFFAGLQHKIPPP